MHAVWNLVLIGVAGANNEGNANARLVWAGLALVAALLIGAAALAMTERWRKKMCGPASDLDRESAFRISYEKGEITEEEYRRVRAALAGGKPVTPPRPSNTKRSDHEGEMAGPPADE